MPRDHRQAPRLDGTAGGGPVSVNAAGRRQVTQTLYEQGWMLKGSDHYLSPCEKWWSDPIELTLPRTAFAAFLAQEADVFDGHAFVDGLEHVVDGEQAHGSRCEGFHFYAGLADCFGAGLDGDSVLIGVQDELDAQVGKRQGMAQRNQRRSLLGALDRGDARDAQHIALGAGAGRVAQGCEGLRR